MSIELMLTIFYVGIGLTLGGLFIYASYQDLETRMLTMKTAVAFMVITALSFVVKGNWFALAAYAIFFIISYFLYDYRVVQIIGGVLMFIASMYFLPVRMGLPLEDAGLMASMGLLWAIAFVLPDRGESDYNVLFTVLAFLGVTGFSWFIFVNLVFYVVFVIFQMFLNRKNTNIVAWMYDVYFRFADPVRRTTEHIKIEYRGKQILLPMIPFLHLTFLLTLIVLGVITQNFIYLGLGIYSSVALVLAVLWHRTAINLKTVEE